MLFNSLHFLLFFALVYSVYLSLQSWPKVQNVFLLVASLYFYAYWDYRFLVLILASAGIDYWAGLKISESDNDAARRRILCCSITANLSILGFFKYFNFFADNVHRVLDLIGAHSDPVTLHLILPIGISFYTFQSMSYGIDVYRGRMQATRDPLAYFLMVAFFPHLVAGPIVRASRLLPQMMRKRTIQVDQVNAGLYLIVWGYWKKVVLADNLAKIVNPVFDHYTHYAGMDVLISVLAFAFQIYGDFSGYTDIARGLSKLMGFELDLNFNLPYFADSPSDFWKRWHITLSTWLRDYLYIPLGGNRGSEWMTWRNLMLTMLLGGLWHGASWTFVAWGFYHGLLLTLYRTLEKTRPWQSFTAWRGSRLPRMALMFVLTCLGWIIFRSHSLHEVAYVVTHLGLGHRSWLTVSALYRLCFLTFPLAIIEVVQYLRSDPIVVTRWSLAFRVFWYTFLLLEIAVLAQRQAQEFIYFQF